MRVLAVDHGAVRAGAAICDPSGTLVTPIGVVEPAAPERVARIAREREAEAIVVGLPLGLAGDEGEQARAAREFARRLEELVDVPVSLHDERLTTRMAEASSRAGARAAPDALAAAHLLEGYLAAQVSEAGEAR